jgi:transglutaminase superfamily protein
MLFRAFRAYLKLIYFDFFLVRNRFAALHEKVRRCPIAHRKPTPQTIEKVCSAVDMACIWYPKPVLCLQRSATTTCLLKKHGLPAQMIIGAQHLPFKAHAWVEVHGQVVNDKPYMREIYSVLDRC